MLSCSTESIRKFFRLKLLEKKFSIFPLGITLKNLRIANDPEFEKEYIITSRYTTISIAILPLFTKTYNQMEYILIDQDGKNHTRFDN